jgi:recombination protein RecR
MSNYPPPLQQLIGALKLLPGVGTKTAERFAFNLLTWKEEQLGHLSDLVASLKQQIFECPICRCLTSHSGCDFCDTSRRDTSLLCVLGSPKDAYIIEQTHAYKGLYHVLGSLLSPLQGQGVDQLDLPAFFKRLTAHPIQEVVIALDSTLEGDATALFLKDQLAGCNIKISRLAFGLPIGSPLEYVDGGTLSMALSGRRQF